MLRRNVARKRLETAAVVKIEVDGWNSFRSGPDYASPEQWSSFFAGAERYPLRQRLAATKMAIRDRLLFDAVSLAAA